MSNSQSLSKILEGILFAAEHPLSIKQLMNLFPQETRPDKADVQAALVLLTESFADHAIELVETASGYRFQVTAELNPWVQNLWQERAPNYSRAVLETLAIIAYRQPVTRAEIESIRGVAVSSPMIKTLLEREWIKIMGHRDVPGKPAILGTTKQFLDYFGLKSLNELPTLADIQSLEQLALPFEQPSEAEAEAAI